MFKPLDSLQKFCPGSQLWLIFFEPQRALFKHINWRTSFLLKNIKEKEDINQPILVDTQKIFPNNSLLCLPLKKKTWITDAYKFWNQLNKPSFRIFIPEAYDEKNLYEHWPQSDSSQNLSYYKEIKK